MRHNMRKVLDLEEAKTAQAKEIASLKQRVKKLEKRRKSRTSELKRLRKGRMIDNIDQDVEITLIDDTQGRLNEEDMFGVNDLDGDEVVVDVTTSEKIEQSAKDAEQEVSTADPVTTADEVVSTAGVEVSAALTILTLIEIKAAKPKVIPKAITTVATTVTAISTRTKAKGIVMQEPSETPSPKSIASSQKPSQAKDEGKEKMVEAERHLKRKEQIMMDEEIPRNLETQLQADLEEEERLARQKEEEANIALIAKWDNTHAMMDTDYELAAKLQEEERGELTIEENSKRAGEELESNKSKKQKLDENVEAKVDDSAKLKKCLEIVLDDEDDVTVDATPLQMFKNFNREDLEALWSIVKAKFKKAKPVDDMDNLLLRTLKTMFEHHIEYTVWTYQQGLAKVKNWKLYDSCGVYCITMHNIVYYLLVEKMIVGIKRLLDDLRVTAAQLVLFVYKVTTVFNKVNAASSRVTTAERVTTAGWIKTKIP
ncbi:hypothetical protein Tco_0917421 [Tanacetum coccineum]